MKKKFVRANHAPYMTKALRKAIMHRSQLESKYFKIRTKENFNLYKKQRNFCSKLYKKEKKQYYNSLDTTKVTDNKEFWKTIKPFLSSKSITTTQISIEKDGKVITDDSELSEEFSIFFDKAVQSLNIKPNEAHVNDAIDLDDPVEIAIKKFENHPSIKAIKENITLQDEFEFIFSNTDTEEISKEISDLDTNKSGTFGNIPTKLIKEFSDVCAPVLNNIWNEEIISQQRFPHNLKIADVTPVFKSR